MGFPVCKKENVAAFQHTKTVRAFVPVLLRVTHHLKSGVLVSSPNLYSPFLRFTYDWKPYCYSTVSMTLSCTPVLFPHFAFINFSEKSRVLYQVSVPEILKGPTTWKELTEVGARTQHLSCAFCTGESTNHTMWRVAVCDTSDKLKVCCKNQNSGVLSATLCHNLQDENLLRHKLSAQVVIRTITLCNLQFGKINITRQVKCFFEWFASCLRNRKWRFPLLQVFHKETVIELVSMT